MERNEEAPNYCEVDFLSDLQALEAYKAHPDKFDTQADLIRWASQNLSLTVEPSGLSRLLNYNKTHSPSIQAIRAFLKVVLASHNFSNS